MQRETNVLRSLFNHAREEWEITGMANLANLANRKLPKKAHARDGRLEDGHGDVNGKEERLREALATWKRSPEVHLDLFDFAIETGLRLSEAHALTTSSVKRVRGYASIELPDSKNGDPRKVALSPKVMEIADRLTSGAARSCQDFPHQRFRPPQGMGRGQETRAGGGPSMA